MKLLAVVQRYGDEVVGGSEGHARAMVQRLARRHEVEVATTTALDYWTWSEHYRAGDDAVGGVPVRRFAVASGRDPDFKAVERRVLFEPHSLAEELDWPRRQGPHAPALLDFLHRKGQSYDAVLFWTYIYEPCVYGLPIVPERAVLIPTAHDEGPLALAPYRALFALPRAIGFLAPEERDLVHRRFQNAHIPSVVLGIGLDPAPDADGDAFRARLGRPGPLVLYLGQVTEGKACDELLRAWTGRGALADATLVLAGTVRMELPERDDVVALGHVGDAEKWAALAAADALVLPSHLESLGIVLLEAWQQGTPALVPAWNAVTAGQVARSGGGATYETVDDLVPELEALLARGPMPGEAGREWVARECDWDAVDRRLEVLVGMAAA
jgi:glycosyltransferase involved in cell wall biosynthesis